MTSRERVLKRERERGYEAAVKMQETAAEKNGTALYEDDDKIPWFEKACKRDNMMNRPIGFVCKSSAGRVVSLIQNYDSSIYTAEPEELIAQWRFVWSKDPAKALNFVSISTSPYDVGDCCKENGVVYRSKVGNNVMSPSFYPDGWEVVE